MALLARLMGLANLIEHSEEPNAELKQWLTHIQESARELDAIIYEIHEKSDNIKPSNAVPVHKLAQSKTKNS